MKKTMILLSILLATPALASQTIPVHNLTNTCSCWYDGYDGYTLHCRKASHAVAVEFGTISGHVGIPTKPPTIVRPGDDGKAPLIIWDEQGFLYSRAHDIRNGREFTTVEELDYPTSLTVVQTDMRNGIYHPQLLNSTWIDPKSCKYSRPHAANLMALLKK